MGSAARKALLLQAGCERDIFDFFNMPVSAGMSFLCHMGRIMGLDYGSRTVGVALSDALGLIASPYETIIREKEGKLRPTLRRITEICREESVELIVLGYPLHMDGTEGERVRKTEDFRDLLLSRLESEGLSPGLVLWDERLSTMEAMDILSESGVPAQERKTYVDRIAAALILEDYMKNGDKKDGR